MLVLWVLFYKWSMSLEEGKGTFKVIVVFEVSIRNL